MDVTTSVAGTNSIMNRKAWELNIEVTSENGAASDCAAPMSAKAAMTPPGDRPMVAERRRRDLRRGGAEQQDRQGYKEQVRQEHLARERDDDRMSPAFGSLRQ